MALEAACVVAEFAPHALHLLEHETRMTHQCGPGGRRPNAAALTLEQGNPEHRLHAANTRACGSQGHIGPVGAAGNTGSLGHMEEQAQIGQVEAHDGAFSIRPAFAAAEGRLSHSHIVDQSGRRQPARMSLLLILTGLTFLLAGFVKGATGLGLPTVSVGLLGLVMAPAQAASLVVVPSLVTNLWQLAAGPRFLPLLRRLWPMLLGIAVGTWSGAGLLTADHAGRATTALGIVLMVYALAGLTALRFHVPSRAEPYLSPFIGMATGLVTAATGVFVVPAVPYLQALALEREDLVQALGLSFTASTVALAVNLAHDGAFQVSVAGTSLLTLAPALAGMFLGQWVRTRVHPEVFRVYLFLGLLVLGGELVLRTAM